MLKVFKEDMMKTRLEMIQEMEKQTLEFLKSGGKVVVLKAAKPRKSEKTFPAIRGSISNIGAKAKSLQSSGLPVRLHQ